MGSSLVWLQESKRQVACWIIEVRKQPTSSPFPLPASWEERLHTQHHPALQDVKQEIERGGTVGIGTASQNWIETRQEVQGGACDSYCRYVNNIDGK